MKRIPSLDGFRAISIILILFCHSRLSAGFPASLTDIAKQAEVGVTVFFVISGLLITNLLLIEEAQTGSVNIKAFYIRRIFRIIPVYILYTIFILIWQNFEVLGITRNNLAHVFTFTVNFDRHKNWFLGHFWSLSVEEQFYLFWPGMLLIARKYLKISLILLIAYSCIARVITYKFPACGPFILSPFFTYSDAIFTGALGGILYYENKSFLKHKIFSSYLMQTSILCLFILFVSLSEHGRLAIITLPFGNLIMSMCILFLILGYIFPSERVIFKMLNSSAVVHVGILSYSIYIWQEFFFVGNIRGFWRIFPYNIVIIYFVSLGSYYLWENQFLKIKKHFSRNHLQPKII